MTIYAVKTPYSIELEYYQRKKDAVAHIVEYIRLATTDKDHAEALIRKAEKNDEEYDLYEVYDEESGYEYVLTEIEVL